jgi:hypothetical protein
LQLGEHTVEYHYPLPILFDARPRPVALINDGLGACLTAGFDEAIHPILHIHGDSFGSDCTMQCSQ